MTPLPLLLFIAVLTLPSAALSQRVAAADPASPSTAPAARPKPTAVEKRCLASRRRVERQQEATAEAEVRVDKERKAREACKSKRACENLDRALKASEARKQRHEKRLAQFDAEAQKACAGLPGTMTAPAYRSSTAASSSPTTTNENRTK